MRNRLNVVVILVLAVLLVGAVGYIVFDKYKQNQNQVQLSAFERGVQTGQVQAITYLFEQAKTCRPVPIMVENQTISVVAVECLQGSG